MAVLQIGGAGGAPSNNVIRSLRESGQHDELVGMSATRADLLLADVDRRYWVPDATAPEYPERLLGLLERVRPDLLHVQHDYEVLAVSRLRDDIERLGVKLYLPRFDTVERCVDKFASYESWKRSGIRVPETVLLESPGDLRSAFADLGPTLWVRARTGTGGQGALPTDDPRLAEAWIDRYQGWGQFTAARCLTPDSVTWLSLWREGELLVAQTRLRARWLFGNRTLSGVTGITGLAETWSSDVVDAVARASILAVDDSPHGIFGVDMTFDDDGFPNPTEINVGRFFTTVYFFTAAGLNMPEIYRNVALDDDPPALERVVNPLPDGLLWIRGMDVEPILTTREEFEAAVSE